jgi:DNA-directed RNA polymerase subunit RPC12/RpoP
MDNQEQPQAGEERDTGWTVTCPNCGYAAFEVEVLDDDGTWQKMGYQCRTCWRTYDETFTHYTY